MTPNPAELVLGEHRAAPIAAYGSPSEADMERINTFARRKLAPTDVYVVRTEASNDQLDSHFTRMDPATSLANYVEDGARGVPVLHMHQRHTLPMGRSFGAARSGNVVSVDYYLPRDMHTAEAANNDVIRAIETGVATDSSITFGGPQYRYRCDVCGADDLMRSEDCTHYPGAYIWKDGKRTTNRATATVVNARMVELSPVWKASNPSTQVTDRVVYLVAKGVLSPAEVAEIDGVTGQRMAAYVDWNRISKRSHFVMTTPETTQPAATEDEKRADILGAALESEVPTQTPEAVAPPAAPAHAEAHFAARLLAESKVEDEPGLTRLLAEAADGRAYRDDLTALCHKAGVRAHGAGYALDANTRMLAVLGTADLRAELASRTKLAHERFRKDVPGEGDPTTEAQRSALEGPVGGRQTVPASGPLGHVATPERSSVTIAPDDSSFS